MDDMPSVTEFWEMLLYDLEGYSHDNLLDRYSLISLMLECGKLHTQPLIEPLSKRELEVLGLLRSELNGPEIARELGVSLATIRTHTQNIYGKLGVNNRRAAVRRAQELDLL